MFLIRKPKLIHYYVSVFGIYHLVGETIKCINFDIISSSDDEQDGASVCRGFRILRQQQFFKDIAVDKDLIIWADAGTHFRCQTFNGYLFKELKDQGIHGKCLLLI